MIGPKGVTIAINQIRGRDRTTDWRRSTVCSHSRPVATDRCFAFAEQHESKHLEITISLFSQPNRRPKMPAAFSFAATNLRSSQKFAD